MYLGRAVPLARPSWPSYATAVLPYPSVWLPCKEREFAQWIQCYMNTQLVTIHIHVACMGGPSPGWAAHPFVAVALSLAFSSSFFSALVHSVTNATMHKNWSIVSRYFLLSWTIISPFLFQFLSASAPHRLSEVLLQLFVSYFSSSTAIQLKPKHLSRANWSLR